jgi:hypothetical protein
MSNPVIVMSARCREIIEDGTKIQVDINRGEHEAGWILGVIDEENASTIWDEPFDTDQEALDTVIKVIELDSIRYTTSFDMFAFYSLEDPGQAWPTLTVTYH